MGPRLSLSASSRNISEVQFGASPHTYLETLRNSEMRSFHHSLLGPPGGSNTWSSLRTSALEGLEQEFLKLPTQLNFLEARLAFGTPLPRWHPTAIRSKSLRMGLGSRHQYFFLSFPCNSNVQPELRSTGLDPREKEC